MKSIENNETIKNLILDLEKRVSDGILEENNLSFIKKLLTKAEDEAEAITICKLGTTFYKTGLIFERKLEAPSDGLKIFEKNKSLSFENGGTKNKLIIGDNYFALLNLQIQYKNKIDVIYIDPPYGANDMGDFAKTNYLNHINRDNLLSMLQSRLMLAKQLLSETGFIFCSIDDKNQAYIKCLFDEIFGEYNFIETFINRSNPRGNQAKKFTASEHEYILCYAKNKNEIFPLGFVKDEVDFKSEDSKGKYNATGLRKRGAGSSREEAPNQYYPIYYNPLINEITTERKESYIEILPKLSNGKDGRWRWSKENIMNKNELLLAKQVKRGEVKEWDIFVKKYYNGEDIEKVKSIFYEKEVNNENATEELQLIFGDKVFSYPKPVYTIKKLIEISSKSDSIVLDFFAGSGTTGQAVLELNKKDNGNRSFILVQLPEQLLRDSTDPITLNGIKLLDKYQMPLSLAYITSERLRRVMLGETYTKNEKIEWLSKNKKLGNSLEVLELVEYSVYDPIIFEKIDETLYGSEKKENVKDKITWVTNNFERVAKKLKDDSVNEKIK